MKQRGRSGPSGPDKTPSRTPQRTASDATRMAGRSGSREPFSAQPSRGIASRVADFVPGIGEARSAVDAVREGRRGNVRGALVAAAGAIPVAGRAGRVVRAADDVADAAKAAKAAKKAAYEIYDTHTKRVVGRASTLSRARLSADRRDNQYGGYRFSVREIKGDP